MIDTLTYQDNLLFRAEYWHFLESEDCVCTINSHVNCHRNMMLLLSQPSKLHAFTTSTYRVKERMQAFLRFTDNKVFQSYALSVILHIEQIEINEDESCKQPTPPALPPHNASPIFETLSATNPSLPSASRT